MNRNEIKAVLEKLVVDINEITDPKVTSVLKILLNLVDVLFEQNTELQKENQRLKDENNRLKGEQGKPDIREQKKDDKNDDHSSENDRKKRNKKKKQRKSKNKKNKIKIDRSIKIEIDDKASLPADAVFKGYQSVFIQDIILKTDNVELLKALYYSPSLNKTFVAPSPAEYKGEFGPGIRSLILILYRESGMTEPAIHRFLTTFDIRISKSTISRMITEGHDVFHQEKEDIISAALEVGQYQHMDDTGCRVNGKNHYTHILCNSDFTAFFTRPRKDRLTLLEILCRGDLKFEFNGTAYKLMSELGVPEKHLSKLKEIIGIAILTRNEVNEILAQLFSNPKKKQKKNRGVICEASAIVYYQNSEYAIKHLMTDDAPQFNMIADHHSLCWIHEGRHFKKLDPIISIHQQALDNFIEQFWDYYGELLTWRSVTERATSRHDGMLTNSN